VLQPSPYRDRDSPDRGASLSGEERARIVEEMMTARREREVEREKRREALSGPMRKVGAITSGLLLSLFVLGSFPGLDKAIAALIVVSAAGAVVYAAIKRP
jgi:hypothetical protein